MCNLYEVGPAPERTLDWELPFLGALTGLPYVAPGGTGVVGRLDRGGRGELEAVRMRWGFRRSWNPAINNTRDDKLSGPMWREAWHHRRCLIPMRRFFEWSGPLGRKTKHAVRPDEADGGWFWVGGVWEVDPGLPEGASYSLITTAASPLMRPLHDRMPLLLCLDQVEDFLKAEDPPLELVLPFPGELWIEPPPGAAQEPDLWF